MTESFQLFNKGKYKVLNKDLANPLGEGSYGTVFMVYKADSLPNDPKMVMKRISKSRLPHSCQYLLYEEVKAMEILRKVNAKHALYSIDHFEDKIYMYHILPFCDGKDLKEYLKEKKFLPENEARDFISQIVDGIFYLHTNGIIHRDIKPANVLLNIINGKLECVVADFGFAKQNTVFGTKQIGTPATMAPEVINLQDGDHYDHKADIYSIGATFYKMLFGKFPYGTEEEIKIIGKNPLKIDKSFCLSKSCLSFLECCLQLDPANRPSITELMNHPFIKEPVPYYLKLGLVRQKGNIDMFHTKKNLTDEVKSKSNANKLMEPDARLEHWMRVCDHQ
jgi:serine/threonine protein kinase